jgi:hypothetical protein
MRNVQLSPAVRMGHVKALEKNSCKYPIRRVEVKVDTIPSIPIICTDLLWAVNTFRDVNPLLSVVLLS